MADSTKIPLIGLILDQIDPGSWRGVPTFGGTIAAAVWGDLLNGADFSTSGSAALLKSALARTPRA